VYYFAIDKCASAQPDVCAPASSGHAVRCCGAHSQVDSTMERSVCTMQVSAEATASGVSNTWREHQQPLIAGHDGANATNALSAAECEARGLRLCTVDELSRQMTCNTGCGHNRRYVWTSSQCNPEEEGTAGN